jgi:hypothetical protein
MMAMIDMKQPAQREEMPGEYEADEPRYPYGLCITLGKDELEKLGITALPKVGTEMMLHAMVYVKSTSAYQTQGEGEKMSMELQITEMGIHADQQARNDDASTMLYGGTE